MSALTLIYDRLVSTFPSLRIDKAVLGSSMRIIKSSSQHFYRVNGGNIIIAQTETLPFSTRKQCSLVVWLGNGEGINLFKEWMRWVEGRKAIRLATFTPMVDDPRLDRFLIKSGFRRLGGVYIWER